MIEFGREVMGRLEAAAGREWLCANGLGGFASGTVAWSVAKTLRAWCELATPADRS